MFSLSPLYGASTIKDGSQGVVLAKNAANPSRYDEPVKFDRLSRDPVYVNIQTAGNQLIHIPSEMVAKIVYFLDPTTFPTRFVDEDLNVVQAKIAELKDFEALDQRTEKFIGPELASLRKVYETESAKYRQSVAADQRKSSNDAELEAFGKKCELMRLELIAARDNIQRSEEIVKEMETLASQSENLAGVLTKWNSEKKRALELADDCKQFWQASLKAHPECFAPARQLKEIHALPADVKAKTADLMAQLDKFRNAVTYPQLLSYCQAEIPAFFLLSQLGKLGDEVNGGKIDDAAALALKTLEQVDVHQIVDPYVPIYAAYKNYGGLAEEVKSQFLRQLAKAKQAEDEATNQELLIEYQKAYDLIPDPKVAARIEQLKKTIKTQ